MFWMMLWWSNLWWLVVGPILKMYTNLFLYRFYIHLLLYCFNIFSIFICFTLFWYKFVLNNVMMKQCVMVSGGGTNIEDIHLAQFTFTEGAKLSPAGSKNSLGTIIMIRPSPHHSNTHSTTHSCTVAQMWDPPSLSLVWAVLARNREISKL